MSTVKVQGNASGSGSITLASPNTNSNRTLNLPDADGTIIYSDSSGNVGIGTTSTSFRYSGATTSTSQVAISTAGYDCLNLISTQNLPTLDFSQPNASSNIFRYAAVQGVMTNSTQGSEAGALTFHTSTGSANVAERARINSDGAFWVGTTTAPTNFGSQQVLWGDFSVKWGMTLNSTSTTGTQYLIAFIRGNSGSAAGSISSTASNSVTYATSSDYRLKENILPMTGALDKVAALKPCTYTWKEDGSAGEGFIAHELAEVCPQAVVGEKDEVHEDGSIKAQGIDTSFLVATLTAAIQEQQAMIKSLTERIAVLETK